jgi:2-dehydro-3-deoxy-L-rhamnonate dehydrogenase (NAD+)
MTTRDTEHRNDDNVQTARVAVVTGGAGGIGLAIAKRLSRDGCQVILWDIDEAALSAAVEHVPDALTYAVDVTNAGSVVTAMSSVIDKFKKVDVLVNGAGLVGPIAPVTECDVEAWQRAIDVNLRSVFLCSKAVVEPMLNAQYGRIVNIASIAGKEGNANWSAYSASKAAVIGFTKAMAKELARTSILINCIAPGIIETKFLEQLSVEALAASISKIPMGRTGEVDEVAALVAWLASAECSFSTGAVYDLSGGRATY